MGTITYAHAHKYMNTLYGRDLRLPSQSTYLGSLIDWRVTSLDDYKGELITKLAVGFGADLETTGFTETVL